MPKVTVGEYIDAIEKNGYPQGFKHSMDSGDANDRVVDACAMGQGNLNLSILEPFALREIRDGVFADSLWLTITMLNDNKRWSIARIAKAVRRKFKNQLDVQMEVEVTDYSYLKNYKGGKFA